jgi:hypothetical protein
VAGGEGKKSTATAHRDAMMAASRKCKCNHRRVPVAGVPSISIHINLILGDGRRNCKNREQIGILMEAGAILQYLTPFEFSTDYIRIPERFLLSLTPFRIRKKVEAVAVSGF